MVFFTTPELLEIGGVPFVSPYDKPTRAEALRYYRKVVERTICRLCSARRCSAIDARRGGGETVFAVETRSEGRAAGRVSRATWSSPSATTTIRCRSASRRGSAARPPLLRRARTSLSAARRHGRRRQFRGRSGARAVSRRRARHARPPAHPSLKRTIKYWVRPDIENRIKEGSIAARFSAQLKEIRPASVVVGPWRMPRRPTTRRRGSASCRRRRRLAARRAAAGGRPVDRQR